MNSSDFIYGLISGVLATLVGFLFAVAWDLWKERTRRKSDTHKNIRLLRQEVGANIQIFDANLELLDRDTEAAKERKEIVVPLSIAHTQVWESTRLAGGLAFLDPDLLKELDLTYMRTLITNQRIQGRELYRLTNQAMSNYVDRRSLINEHLIAEIKGLLSRFGKHAQDLKREPS